MTRIAMVHTAPMNAVRFQELADELLPGVEVEHVVDESLLQDTIAAGSLTADVRDRFVTRANALRATDVDLIVLTCSSIGVAADAVPDGQTPVIRIDIAMAEEAVRLGTRIGVAATLPTTLGPTSELIYRAADRANRAVDVRSALAEGAFALLATDPAEHDARVRSALTELATWADVIVLAQASMTRAIDGPTIVVNGRGVPLLTSPRLGVERLAATLAARQAAV